MWKYFNESGPQVVCVCVVLVVFCCVVGFLFGGWRFLLFSYIFFFFNLDSIHFLSGVLHLVPLFKQGQGEINTVSEAVSAG